MKSGEGRKALVLTVASSYLPSCFPVPIPRSVLSQVHSWPNWPDTSGQTRGPGGLCCMDFLQSTAYSPWPGSPGHNGPEAGSQHSDPDVLGGKENGLGRSRWE